MTVDKDEWVFNDGGIKEVSWLHNTGSDDYSHSSISWALRKGAWGILKPHINICDYRKPFFNPQLQLIAWPEHQIGAGQAMVWPDLATVV